MSTTHHRKKEQPSQKAFPRTKMIPNQMKIVFGMFMHSKAYRIMMYVFENHA